MRLPGTDGDAAMTEVGQLARFDDRANACEYHRRHAASGPRWKMFRSGLPWRAKMFALPDFGLRVNYIT
jgi:hypothetical protein